MIYKVFQSLKCGYREMQSANQSNHIVRCPDCGNPTRSHESELSEALAGQLSRSCKFAESLNRQKSIDEEKAESLRWKKLVDEERRDAEDANFYNENYDENGNYITELIR